MIRSELAATRAPRDEVFAFEPLVAIARMLRLPESSLKPLPSTHRPTSVGGAPQVVRVLPGATATAFAVRWPDRVAASEFIYGRERVGYERLDAPLLEIVDDHVQIEAPGQWTAARDDLKASPVV
jgi:hypothetical protein